MADEHRLPIGSEHDILTARQRGRELAAEIAFTLVRDGQSRGIVVVARDEGPGIPDAALAMQDGYSTGRSLGLGLPGARRLMDEFDLQSEVGRGTTVTMKKWIRSRSVR